MIFLIVGGGSRYPSTPMICGRYGASIFGIGGNWWGGTTFAGVHIGVNSSTNQLTVNDIASGAMDLNFGTFVAMQEGTVKEIWGLI